ncbi:MAG TPA: hypothetical protein VF758_09395 [Candidatus Acidoferrum sp.]
MMKRLLHAGAGLLVLAAAGSAAFGQAKPYPSGDVRLTYERLLKQID